MAVCKKCGTTVGYFDIVAGSCSPCRDEAARQIPEIGHDGALTEITKLENIALSTEAIPCGDVVRRLGLVSATCVYGQHLGKDIAGAWRDVLGGRAQSIERVFNDARDTAMLDLKRAAHGKGANAVFAIQVTHQELSGGGKSMVLVTAVGTAMLLGSAPIEPSGSPTPVTS